MKKDIIENIKIPENIKVSMTNDRIEFVSGDKKIAKTISYNPNIKIENKNGEIKITSKKATKRELKIINTAIAHINNMIKGIDADYVYKLEICNVHFPMNVKVSGSDLIIKNFLGEKIDRVAKIMNNVSVNVNGNIIEIKSIDIESAGQTAANIEKATKIKKKDRRVFQDGIFITEKPEKK